MKIHRSLFLIFIIYSQGSFGCSIFNTTIDDITLIGNNEDWREKESYIKIIPAHHEKYGRIFFGFGENCRYTFGGVNDQGVFYDIASLTRRNDIKFDPDKEIIDNSIYEKILEECANVDESIELINRYNVNGFRRHHIMLVDKSGTSAIIEWGKDSLSVMRKKSTYQVMTNFNNTDPALAGWYPCRRFEKVASELENIKYPTVENFRQILKSVHNSGPDFPTVYSNIYDLKDNIIYIYHFHNFEEYYMLNSREEFEKKEHIYYLPSLFSNLKLLKPLMHENVSTSSVDLIWQGNADSYQLFCSTDSSFNNSLPIEIFREQLAFDNSIASKIVFLCLFPFMLSIYRKRRMVVLFFIPTLLCFLLMTCETQSKIKATLEYRYTITDLEKNSIYYWKVLAIRSSDISSSSIIKSFRTSN